MKIFASEIKSNDDDPSFKWIEVLVEFWGEDSNIPTPCAKVKIFLEKNEQATLALIRAAAIQKAHDFLLTAISRH